MTLNIDISTGNLLAGFNNPSVVSPLTLLFYSNTTNLPMQIYLFAPLNDYEASQFNYSLVTGQAQSLSVQIDDGTPAGIAAPLALQNNWILDPQMQEFYSSNMLSPVNGGLALNTNAGGVSGTGILGLFTGGALSVRAYLRISAAYFGVVAALPIIIYPGPNLVGQAVPQGQTALSLQQALALFVQWQQNAAGRGIVLTSPAGHTIEISAQDNGDGTARIDETELS